MFNTADEELINGEPTVASGGETQEDEGGDTEEWTRGTEGRGESAADNWFWFVTGRVRVCQKMNVLATWEHSWFKLLDGELLLLNCFDH